MMKFSKKYLPTGLQLYFLIILLGIVVLSKGAHCPDPRFDVFGEYATPVWVILWVSIISGTLSLGAYILLKYSEWRNK